MSRESNRYVFSKDKCFSEGVSIADLHSHIKSGIPTATLLGITHDGDDVVLDFQDPLGLEELNTMDTCISSYIYSPPTNVIHQIISIDMNATTANERYETFNRIIFPGTICFEIPSKIKFISKKDESVINYSLRIIDANENVICEENELNNDDEQIVTCTSINNLSDNESIWYIQGKIDGGAGNIYVYNAHINY